MSLLNLSHDSSVTIIMRALSCLTINTIVRDLHGHLDYIIELEETENMAVCPVHLARGFLMRRPKNEVIVWHIPPMICPSNLGYFLTHSSPFYANVIYGSQCYPDVKVRSVPEGLVTEQ